MKDSLEEQRQNAGPAPSAPAPLRLAIIVVEFPSVTETFIARDVAKFIERGHAVRLYHLGPYDHEAPVHAFARPVVDIARGHAFLFSRPVLRALGRALLRRPGRLAGIFGRIVAACWREPAHLAKSLAIVPKSLAIAEELAAWPADHVHAEFAGHPGTAAWIVGRMTGLPYSMSCRAHDIFVTQALLGPKVAESAFVRTISDYNVGFLSQALPAFDRTKAFVVHSSIDAGAIEAEPVRRGETFRVLFVGSLEQRKGADVLLRALAAASGLGRWRCDLIGEGPLRGRLEALARELGIADRTHFLGARPFEEVAAHYRAADVVVAPSGYGPRGRTEGIPNVVIEGLAHRRPVITTAISGIPELIEEGVTGRLVAPGDVAALARALEEVECDPAAAAAMAEAGHRAVRADFDLERNVDTQLQLFDRFTPRRRAA
jgi:colanic acid/amylovoran biosynthesis glycosyltransferase